MVFYVTCATCITNLGLSPSDIFVVRVFTDRIWNFNFRVFSGGYPEDSRKAWRPPDNIINTRLPARARKQVRLSPQYVLLTAMYVHLIVACATLHSCPGDRKVIRTAFYRSYNNKKKTVGVHNGFKSILRLFFMLTTYCFIFMMLFHKSLGLQMIHITGLIGLYVEIESFWTSD